MLVMANKQATTGSTIAMMIHVTLVAFLSASFPELDKVGVCAAELFTI